jgi:hypothetical protein
MPPLALALMIASPFIIALAYWVQRAGLYRGYQPVAGDIRQIAHNMGAKVFRDGSDLVIAGSHKKLPVMVRLTNDEGRAPFRIQMRARMPFSLSLTPQDGNAERRQGVIRTGSYLLDSKFTTTSSQPTQAKMLFHDDASLSALNKLCYSKQTEFSIAPGEMELVEPEIPAHLASRVSESLQSMLVLARLGEQIPGAEKVEVLPLAGNRPNWKFRAVIAAGVLLAVSLLWASPDAPSASADEATFRTASIPGMPNQDAAQIRRLQGWHVANQQDFSETAAQFLDKYSLPAGRIAADFGGKGMPDDHVYLLANSHGKRRVTMLVDGTVAFDEIFDQAPLIARIPGNKFTSLKWTSPPAGNPDGDLLLIVFDMNAPAANLVLFRSGNQTVSGALEDFASADLTQ